MTTRIPRLINAAAIDITSTGFRPRVTVVFDPDPELVLQAYVERIGTADEGAVVQTLQPAWQLLKELLSKDPAFLQKIDPRRLEELIAASYASAGFDEVILTPRSGDFGRDVIASKRGWGCIRIIDQVKAFSPGHVVSANDVRALLGVLSGDPRATKGIVTTTSTFAPRLLDDPFVSPFVPYRLELVDGEALRQRILAPPRSGRTESEA